MQIQSVTTPVRSFSAAHRRLVAVGAAVAVAGTGAVALTSGDDAVSIRSITPVVSTGGAEDLSSYDGALLRHHGLRVTPASVGAELRPTAAQRLAAERFHHR